MTASRAHVWCGAFNMAVGDIVPLATLGTTMPDGRTIERRGILGIDSEGMLCAADELGLGDDHSGILILPPGTPLGVPYDEALGRRPPTCCSTSTSPATGPTAGATSASPATSRPRWASNSACHDPELTTAGESPHGARRARRRRALWALHEHGDVGRAHRPERAVDAAATHRRRHAPDQQRRRRLELRDARAQPAEPRLRPRHARAAEASGSAPHATANG